MRLGVVGGSSLTSFDPTTEFEVIGLKIVDASEITQETSYGAVKMKKFELDGGGQHHTIVFMQRHSHVGQVGIGGAHGICPPHKINYHANMKAMHDLKLDAVIATSAVGASPALAARSPAALRGHSTPPIPCQAPSSPASRPAASASRASTSTSRAPPPRTTTRTPSSPR